MIEELEQLRKAAIMNRVTKYGLTIGIPLLFGVIAGVSWGSFAGGAGCFLFPCLLLSTLWAKFAKNRPLAQYRATYKKVLIEAALEGVELYEDMEFAYDAGIAPQFVSKTGLLPVNSFYSDCYISGVSEGVRFVQADIRNVSGSRNNGFTVDYDGTFIAFETTLPDATQTHIWHKNADIGLIVPGNQYKTGNGAFDGEFCVYSNNPSAASALLDGAFISKLTEVQKLTERKLVMTVKKGWVYAFFPNKKSALVPKLFAKYDASMNGAVLKELSLAKELIRAFR